MLLRTYRFAKYYKTENGTDYRKLIKAYAIRFDVLVNGNVSHWTHLSFKQTDSTFCHFDQFYSSTTTLPPFCSGRPASST